MAAASEKQPTQMKRPQEILSEVRKFIRGANYDGKISSEELGNSALFLLRTLPAARHAVLEYLCNVFTEAVNCHLLSLQGNGHTMDTGPKYDNIIQNATGVLLNFVRSNPSAWASIISSWSLGLLGELSFTKRGAVRHSDSLNEVLQLWMTCPATKALIEIATECFDAMVSGAPDVCVDSLLEASVKYSPYFDWVVAHIGSCFPKTIITRVLMCGLKDFCPQSESTSSSTEDKTPKMASVVGILGHLASKHEQDIRRSLMNLFQESLLADEDPKKLSTVPFLLQLASMSPMLLQVLTTDFLKALTPDVLNHLQTQFSLWKSMNLGDYDSLLSLVIHLVMKSDVGAIQVFRFLMDVAFPSPRQPGSVATVPYNETVQSIGLAVLKQLTNDLQKAVFNRRQNSTIIPFLRSLASHNTDMARELLSSEGERSDWTCRILGYVCLYNDTGCASDVLAYIISQSKSNQQRAKFLHLQLVLESRMDKVLQSTVGKIADNLEPQKDQDKAQILKNLLYIVKWEKRKASGETHIARSILYKALQKHITLFSLLLNHPEDSVAVTTLELLQAIGIPNSLQSDVLLHLCNSLTSILFRSFGWTDTKQTGKVQRLCAECVKMLCTQPCAQSLILKGLIEAVTAPETRELVGGKINIITAKMSANQPVSLFHENSKHGLSMTLPQSHSSVFHAGIIGSGLKPRQKPLPFSKDLIQRNKNYFLDILWLASCPSNPPGQSPEYLGEITPGPSPTLGRKIASLLVHLLTPDVLYNSIAWREEDFMRVTIERDLYIRKQFDENPILWDIIEILSVSQMFTCFCSPILRSLTATLIIHFENSRDKSARNSPKHLEAARRVLYIMKKGKILPFPLCNIGEILAELSPFEVHLLLLITWKYIKENSPKLDGLPTDCDVRYLETLRAILHKNISILGHHYSLLVDATKQEQS